MKLIIIMTTVLLSFATVSAQSVPADAKATCTVTATEFASWFETGAPTLNGVAKPADSLNFPDMPNCPFYRWAKQMFLWLTSPAPVTPDSAGRIFDSPIFFDVSPPDQNGRRTLIPHTATRLRLLNVRPAKVGPHGLPIVFDKSNRMLEIERRQLVPGAKPSVRNTSGRLIEVERATPGTDGNPILMDKAGKKIAARLAPKPTGDPRNQVSNTLMVRKFMINGIPIFLDANGNVVEVEPGQAQDSGVLQAQNGSLVYYTTDVNDVFAYFLTAVATHQITTDKFPTTPAELNQITAFAAAHGKTFSDANALAVEVKSSWIETAGLPNASSYITMPAIIPTYDKSNPNQWTPNGQKTAQMALVGMHVVGSTKGHPEMIWATFEHLGNAPNGTYSYVNTNNQMTEVTQTTAGTWLFSASNSSGPFNVMHMKAIGTDIAAVSPHTISPSDTIRWKAWGAASDVSPNPIDGNAANSNTEIISIHNSVSAMMPAGDVRNNYIMTGATWTIFGASPSPDFRNQVGTSRLANSTMETYQQGRDRTASNGGTNCFSCHRTNTTAVSHVFPFLEPLPLPPSPPQLTLRAVLVHPDHNHLRLFNLQIDGVTVRANVNAGSTGPRVVSPGTHTVGETGGTGTSLGAFHTVIGGDCAANGTVSLGPGESKTCTITNYDNFGGCTGKSRCCEPGNGTQGCQLCIGPRQQCP